MQKASKMRVVMTLSEQDERVINALEANGIDPRKVVAEGIARFKKAKERRAKKISARVGV